MMARDATPALGMAPASRSGSEASIEERYRSLFVVGRGGMGTVEAALEVGSERVVALKRLPSDSARDKRRVDMFLREARIAALLDHPNVVRAFDYGDAGGQLYLAMEYVEGQPLSRLLQALATKGDRLPVRVAAWIVAEVCRGLHAAHELVDPKTKQSLEVVHRDVSPQNVMIGYDGRVHLLDFGVAKMATESVTKTGEVKGKTAYMSPEQAMGDPVDRRSDLFSAGAVLFECLTLRRMWGEGTDMETIRKLALEMPPSLAEADASIPAALTTLQARLVAREASDRPASALDVASELAPIIEDEPGVVEELRRLLAAHFGEQAREQRAKLAAALAHGGVETSEARASRASSGDRPSSARSATIALVVALALALVFAVGKCFSAGEAKPSREPASSPTAPVTATASAQPAEAVSPPPAASVVAAPSANPVRVAPPAALPSANRVRVAPPAALPSARPAKERPAPSTRTMPSDVDEKPF